MAQCPELNGGPGKEWRTVTFGLAARRWKAIEVDERYKTKAAIRKLSISGCRGTMHNRIANSDESWTADSSGC
jgi:hypothetical protein